MKKYKLTQSILREAVSYDELTGVFLWRIAGGKAKVGKVAGYVGNHGYRAIQIRGQRHQAGRLAWLYVTGKWPKGQIDHKNMIKDDQIFKNLRDVTASGNKQNLRTAMRNNKNGFLGASIHKGKFQATIMVKGKRLFLGKFATPQEAHEAYVKAKRRLHPTCTI